MPRAKSLKQAAHAWVYANERVYRARPVNTGSEYIKLTLLEEEAEQELRLAAYRSYERAHGKIKE